MVPAGWCKAEGKHKDSGPSPQASKYVPNLMPAPQAKASRPANEPPSCKVWAPLYLLPLC